MISVVLATHNEEANLAACLDAVKEWADEIVIVDGESLDSTVAIAQRYKAKVISTTNKANFHINKQMAIESATGDLIVQLDADEIVDEELAAFIKDTHLKLTSSFFSKPDWSTLTVSQKKALLADHYVAWYCKRKNFLLGRWLSKGGQYPDAVIRVFIAHLAYLPQKDVHEQIAVEGNVGTAAGHLLHYSNPSFEVFVRKWNHYTSFKASQWFDEKMGISIPTSFRYLIFQPLYTFCLLYFRHRGYVDGFAGFVFAAMSGLYFPVSYLKLWELYQKETSKGTSRAR
jgi:glycosyltransferase involved in cell wall biosynthesis